MEKLFTVAVQGNSDIIYEDNSCVASIVVADLRDECWYIGMGKVLNKKTQDKCKLTLSQKKVLLQRISYELHQELYSDDLKIIMCEDKNIIDAKLMDLLEVNE